MTGNVKADNTSDEKSQGNEAPELSEQEKRDAHYAEGHVTAAHEEQGGQFRDHRAKSEQKDDEAE